MSENLNEMVELGKELKFCVSEEAGLKTLKSTFDRMVSVLDAIPSSIQAAGLSSDDQAKLTTAVEKIQAACKNAQLDSEASYAGLCKDMADPLEVVETHSQQ